MPPSPTLLTRKFLVIYMKRRARKKGKKNREEKNERMKIEKGKKGLVENSKWKEEKIQNEARIFFFFFFYFSLFKPLKFVLVPPKWEFSTRKKTFQTGKKIKQNYSSASSEKYSSYTPAGEPLKEQDRLPK